jgi:hypothetical protein
MNEFDVVTGGGDPFAELEASLQKAALSPSDIERCMRTACRPVEELTLSEFLLTMLHLARAGLRRKRIDEVSNLREYLLMIPQEHRHLVPPEVVRFMVRFKRPRGRMRSRHADFNRFWSNPNRVAAFLAASHVKELREKHGGRYKITTSDGSKSTISAEAVRLAVATVNKSLKPSRADPRQVAALLGKGKRRVAPPRDPFEDPLNPRD